MPTRSSSTPGSILLALLAGFLLSGCGNDASLDEATASDPVEISLDGAHSIQQAAPSAGPNLASAFFVAPHTGGVVADLESLLLDASRRPTRFNAGTGLALVVFQGVHPTGGYDLVAQRFLRDGTDLALEVRHSVPDGQTIPTQAFSQPALIVPLPDLEDGAYQALLALDRVIGDQVLEPYHLEGQIAFTIGSVATP